MLRFSFLLVLLIGCSDDDGTVGDAGTDATDAARIDTGASDSATDAEADAEGDADPGSDAEADAEADVGGDAAMSCGRTWPERPDLVDGPNEVRYFALRNVVLDQAATWDSIGWDLDGWCTESTATTGCLPPDELRPVTDGVEGADNAFGRNVLPLLIEAIPTLETEVRQTLTEREPLVLRLSEFELADDDARTDLGIVGSVRVTGFDGRFRARWDGEDFWVRNEDGLNSVGEPLVQDRNGYVNDGTFVMRMPDRQPIPLPWAGGRRVHLRLLGGVLTGRLVFEGGDYRAVEQVWIQGRMLIADLETLLDEAGICDGPLRDSVLDAARRSLDVEGLRPDPVCGAISVVLPFEGTLATRGGSEPPRPTPPACE